MSWEIKYTVEWTDILGLDWKADIEEDDFAGTVTTLQATSNPLTIEYLSPSDDLYDSPIKGSKADVTVYSDTDFALTDLYATDDKHFRMSIYYNNGSDVLFWRGYNVTDNYSEPYSITSYQVTISASDGLGLLKNIPFDNAGTPYNDKLSQRETIINILAKIGITTFTEYVNIYETNHNSTVDDSPLDQTFVDMDVYLDLDCYQVLESILKSYDAVIRQYLGVMIIYRPKELTNTTMYGRIFTAASVSSTTISPNQFINRDIISSDIIDLEGGTMMIKSPAKQVNINQDYGSKESWLDNYKFERKDFTGVDPSDFNPNFWHREGGILLAPVSELLGTDTDGVVFISHNTYPSLTQYIYQTFGVYAKTTTDLFKFSFEYMMINMGTIDRTGQSLYCMVLDADGNYWLEDVGNGYLDWTNTPASLLIAHDAPVESDGWQKYEKTILGLPIEGPYTITFYAIDDDIIDVYGAIKNVEFYATSDAIVTKTWKNSFIPFIWRKKSVIIYTDNIEKVKNIYEGARAVGYSTNGTVLDYDYIIGDVDNVNITNVLDQFAGALSVTSYSGGTSPTARVDEITKDSTAEDTFVRINGYLLVMVWDTDEATTCANFVALYATTCGNVTLSYTPTDDFFIATANVAGVDFIGPTQIVDGSVATLTPNDPGTTPTATLVQSTTWNTRGGSESSPLLEIIGDELALQYSRPKQMLSLPVMEGDSNTVPHINLIGNFQDVLNSLYGNTSNLVTTWVNVNYETFAVSGTAVTAIETDTAGGCRTNTFTITDNQVLTAILTVTLNSGAYPLIIVRDTDDNNITNGVTLVAGFNEVDLTLTTTGSGSGRLWLLNTSATNFSTSDIILIKKPRKFAFNRGLFKAIDREWDLDLVEVI